MPFSYHPYCHPYCNPHAPHLHTIPMPSRIPMPSPRHPSSPLPCPFSTRCCPCCHPCSHATLMPSSCHPPSPWLGNAIEVPPETRRVSEGISRAHTAHRWQTKQASRNPCGMRVFWFHGVASAGGDSHIVIQSNDPSESHRSRKSGPYRTS